MRYTIHFAIYEFILLLTLHKHRVLFGPVRLLYDILIFVKRADVRCFTNIEFCLSQLATFCKRLVLNRDFRNYRDLFVVRHSTNCKCSIGRFVNTVYIRIASVFQHTCTMKCVFRIPICNVMCGMRKFIADF